MNYPQVKNFLVFVEIDAEINELESDKSLVENLLVKANKLIDNYQSQITSNNLKLSDIRKNHHSLELDLKSIHSQEADKKQKLERITNSREFNALHQELEDIIKRKAKLEESYFNSWQELELLENELSETNKNLELSIAHEEGEIKNLKRRMASIENQRREAYAQKDQSIGAVDEELLSQYTSMKQSTKNPVVKAKGDVCGGCYYYLAPQDLASLELHKLVRCKNCYRILYNPNEPVE